MKQFGESRYQEQQEQFIVDYEIIVHVAGAGR